MRDVGTRGRWARAALALLATLSVTAAGCGADDGAGGSSGYTQVGDVAGRGGLGGDAAGDDDTAATDDDVATGADASATDATTAEGSDIAVEDIGADTGAATDASADVPPADAGSVDSGAPDVAATDSDAIDAGGNTCNAKAALFAAAAAKAKVCASDFDCYGPAKAFEGVGWQFGGATKAGCGCATYYNGNSADTQALVDLDGEYTKAGCPDSCPNVDCAGLKGTVGRCQAGSCAIATPSCAEIEASVKLAVAAGRACTSDAQCSPFGMQGELPCGCPVNVNLDKMAPGQPIFLYVTMMAQAYNALGCAKDVACACPSIGAGVCKNNICETKSP